MSAMTLEPCPFCGSDKTLFQPRAIECQQCGALGPEASRGAVAKESADLWNRRCAHAQMVEKVREVIELLRILPVNRKVMGINDKELANKLAAAIGDAK